MSKRKQAKKAGYDSALEKDLASNELSQAEYHPGPYQYTVPATVKTYTPDFRVGDTLIEVKGFFRQGDPQKYKTIAQSLHEQGFDFVFLFENSDKKMPGVRKRKDGSYLTMREWADKMGIKWFTRDTIKEFLGV